jgi:cell division protein FtsA
VLQLNQVERRPFPRKVLAEIIASRMREIYCLTRDEIETYLPFGNLAAGLVVTGGGSLLDGAVEFAEETLNTPARTGIPERLHGLGDMLVGPEHAAVVGLIKYGLKFKEEESVAAETGDWRKLIRNIQTIFTGKSREDGN